MVYLNSDNVVYVGIDETSELAYRKGLGMHISCVDGHTPQHSLAMLAPHTTRLSFIQLLYLRI